MTSSKPSTHAAALRREALNDLLETSVEQLRREAAEDGEDLGQVANRVRSILQAAIASTHPERVAMQSVEELEGFADFASEFRVPDRDRSRFLGGNTRRWAAVTTAALLAVVSWALHDVSRTIETYANSSAESRTVVLGDGSTAILNTKTRLTWADTTRERRVQLQDGEALFEVTDDKNRPFKVSVEGSEIRVLGTEFDVYRKPNGPVVVTVLKGTVSVRAPSNQDEAPLWERTLTRNEQMEYTATRLLSDVHPTDATEAVAWRDGRIIVKNGTLHDLVEELNRYSSRPIVLKRDLEHRRIFAVFPNHGIDESLKNLQSTLPELRISYARDGTIVLSDGPEPPPSIPLSNSRPR